MMLGLGCLKARILEMPWFKLLKRPYAKSWERCAWIQRWQKNGINLQQGGVRPPEQVQAAFDDVLKAGQERERAKNEAQAYANDVIPRAVGSASRLKEEADAYKARVVAQAQGDAQRFSAVLAEYKKAPQVTRDRMYLESMQQIYASVTKVLVDSRQGSSLLYLPLDKILQMNAAPAAFI